VAPKARPWYIIAQFHGDSMRCWLSSASVLPFRPTCIPAMQPCSHAAMHHNPLLPPCIPPPPPTHTNTLAPLQAYVSYKVITRTRLPQFRSERSEVIRRFRDFVWLQHRMRSEYRCGGGGNGRGGCVDGAGWLPADMMVISLLVCLTSSLQHPNHTSCQTSISAGVRAQRCHRPRASREERGGEVQDD
jgi:hypothetical protein